MLLGLNIPVNVLKYALKYALIKSWKYLLDNILLKV